MTLFLSSPRLILSLSRRFRPLLRPWQEPPHLLATVRVVRVQHHQLHAPLTFFRPKSLVPPRPPDSFALYASISERGSTVGVGCRPLSEYRLCLSAVTHEAHVAAVVAVYFEVSALLQHMQPLSPSGCHSDVVMGLGSSAGWTSPCLNISCTSCWSYEACRSWQGCPEGGEHLAGNSPSGDLEVRAARAQLLTACFSSPSPVYRPAQIHC